MRDQPWFHLNDSIFRDSFEYFILDCCQSIKSSSLNIAVQLLQLRTHNEMKNEHFEGELTFKNVTYEYRFAGVPC